MAIFSINPKTKIDDNNILNIMSQLVLEISNSIQSIYNIINDNDYSLMINSINSILNNYFKVYNYYGHGITNVYVQIYNQNIELVAFVNIKLTKYNYTNLNSNYSYFITGLYNNQPKIIYQELTQEQKNNLRYSIVSDDLYFIDEIQFIYNSLNTSGNLIKPKTKTNSCECTNINNNNNIEYTYISTIYWN